MPWVYLHRERRLILDMQYMVLLQQMIERLSSAYEVGLTSMHNPPHCSNVTTKLNELLSTMFQVLIFYFRVLSKRRVNFKF